MYDERGSVWRKWDLHIHCPTTALNNQFEGSDDNEKWENYLDKLEEVDDVSVLGITDYFSIDGYLKTVKFKKEGKLSNFDLILPNCELRITPFTSEESAINFHFIFNPEIVEELDTLFFSNLVFEYESEPYRCRKDDLIRLGRAYRNDEGLDENTAYREGVNQFKTTPNQISEVLKKSKKLRDNSLTGVSNSNQDGNSGIQHSSLAATREEIYRLSDFIFSSNPNDIEYFLGEGIDTKQEVKRKYGSLKPCIHGSDAHKLEDICAPDLDRFTWIKSDPTFEGLRQIIFEPKYRVKIDSSLPNEPLLKINKVGLELPEDSKLDDQDYCLKGEYDIQFSPFFTCLIGGRGTGKSSILNLIDHLISDEENKFFDQHDLTDGDGNKLDIEDVVNLDEKSEKGDLEFLSQNEIEDFASDQHRFTQAIYRRLKKLDSQNEIEDSVKKVNQEIEKIDLKINQYGQLKALRVEIIALQKEVEKNQNILASLQDEEYQKNSQELSDKNKRLKRIKNSQEVLEDVLNSIDKITEKIPSDLDMSIPFERVLSEIANSFEDITDEYNIEQLSEEASAEIVSLEGDIDEITKKINQFLQEKGLSEENLKEASSAKTNLDSLNEQIKEKEQRSRNIRKQLEEELVSESAKDDFKNILEHHIESINEKFKTLDEEEHVKEIELEYDFDSESAKANLVEAVQSWIKNSETQIESDLRSDYLEDRLPTEIQDYETFIDQYKTEETVIASDLEKHFADEINFEIYNLIIKREFYNAVKYKQVNVFYDGRPIRNTSFGQRCTAAIIILLSLGNNPIIIDEPEAHLDSALIADNLVDLIKSTKSQRQIIFATHNANFVVNGDAELIHVLWIDENDGNKMKITSSTIENLDNRHHLFALEGGEEAFKQRETRYNIS